MDQIGELEAIPAVELASSLAPIEGDLESLIEVLQHPLAMAPKHQADFHVYGKHSDAARGLLALGTSRLSAQDPDGAMEAFLSALRLAIETRRGGLEVHDLGGVALSAMSLSYPYRIRYQVSSETRTMACADLAQMIDRLEPVETFQKREWDWIRAQGWHAGLRILIDDWVRGGALDFVRPTYNEIRNEELAKFRLLILELALGSYAIDHGHYPESLENLVPHYVATLPLDPFAKSSRGFTYRVSDGDYQLYSLSWNGIDDGENAHPSDPASGVVDRSVGDLSLRHISAN